MSEVVSVFKSACFLSFFQLVFSCLRMTMFHKYTWMSPSQVRNGLSQQYSSYASFQEEKRLLVLLLWLLLKLLSQREPPVKFWGYHPLTGQDVSGFQYLFALSCCRRQRHVWSPTAEVGVQCDLPTCLQCFLQLPCSTCISSQSTGTQGDEGQEQEREVICA